MASAKRIQAKPSSYDLSGFKLEELVSQKFLVELRKEIPAALVAGLVIGFSDDKHVVILSLEREDGKFISETVGLGGEQPQTDKVLHVLEGLESL